MYDKSGQTNKGSYKMNTKWNRNNKYKKNFGSLQEGHGLAFLQKQKIQKQYLKQIKKEELKNKRAVTNEEGPSVTNEISERLNVRTENNEFEAFEALPMKKRKMSKLKRAQLEFEENKKQKMNKREEKERIRKEIEEKRKIHKEKKLKRNIKLSQKTRKGQPLMRSRMDLLLETLEQNLANEK